MQTTLQILQADSVDLSQQLIKKKNGAYALIKLM